LPADLNPLIVKENPRLSWWTAPVFVVALVLLCGLGLGLLKVGGVLSVDHTLILLTALYGGALAAIAVTVAPMGRRALPAMGLRGARWRLVLFGVVGTVALSMGVSHLGIEPQGVKQVMEFVREPGVLTPSLIVLAVLAPLVEELIFRGLLYGWIEGLWTWAAGRWPRLPAHWATIVAWIVSSLAFAAAHYEPAHIVLVLPLGNMFGWLRRRTDSLLPSFIAHVVNNGFAVLGAALSDD
jgi:membrane protease YdiL (CAAX protease family)